ncbi:MAG: entericidin [Burkholderiales bacterium]|nr:entericidin [Burkholderiales bacterium]
MFKKILAGLALIGVFGSFAGCNTVDGMGRDLGVAGQATSDTARDVGKKM